MSATSRISPLIPASSPFSPRKYFAWCFLATVYREKSPSFSWDSYASTRQFLAEKIHFSADQKTSSLLGDDRFTALMPAEMSYSNRLGRAFQ
jgi:hypothetical protein